MTPQIRKVGRVLEPDRQAMRSVDGTRKLNRAWHPKIDHPRREPGSHRAGEEVGVERGGLG
jgi:hypothetical protein